MKKLIFIIFLTTSCIKNDVSKLNTNENIDFNKDYSISEFKRILDSYNDQKGYPNIDK